MWQLQDLSCFMMKQFMVAKALSQDGNRTIVGFQHPEDENRQLFSWWNLDPCHLLTVL